MVITDLLLDHCLAFFVIAIGFDPSLGGDTSLEHVRIPTKMSNFAGWWRFFIEIEFQKR